MRKRSYHFFVKTVLRCPNSEIGSFLFDINHHIKYFGCIFMQPTCIPLSNLCVCFYKYDQFANNFFLVSWRMRTLTFLWLTCFMSQDHLKNIKRFWWDIFSKNLKVTHFHHPIIKTTFYWCLEAWQKPLTRICMKKSFFRCQNLPNMFRFFGS